MVSVLDCWRTARNKGLVGVHEGLDTSISSILALIFAESTIVELTPRTDAIPNSIGWLQFTPNRTGLTGLLVRSSQLTRFGTVLLFVKLKFKTVVFCACGVSNLIA